MSNIENASEQLICLYERVSGCEVSEIINTDLEYLADVIEGEMDANESCIKDLIKQLSAAKNEIAELRAGIEYAIDNFGYYTKKTGKLLSYNQQELEVKHLMDVLAKHKAVSDDNLE
ncbi:hypothetical protein EQ875_01641 [Photobacterium damselae subsp. damselae]|uniref:hypothetical protein n=1 Tax=Photobacterium damselae TaxID=38293 RepID=UPI00109BD782|nr:hypothetical protein [Photobacterium damselae]TGZ35360.1 hypothetical protein EQ875_01641 [Photobacterium damselae subsp. damselae]